MNKKQLIVAWVILILIVGCDYSKSKAKETNNEIKGRKETKNLEAVGIVGYDGQAVRSTVDKVLDQNDERLKELEKVMGTNSN